MILIGMLGNTYLKLLKAECHQKLFTKHILTLYELNYVKRYFA